MIKVMAIDDHPLFCEGLRAMFTEGDGIVVTDTMTDGNQAIARLKEVDVDVILTDLNMPNMHGLELIKEIKANGIDTPILVLTMYSDISHLKKALARKVSGYILKDASKQELMEAINKVAEGKTYFHPKVHDQVFDYLGGSKSSRKEEVFSPREKEVIEWIAKGLRSKEIAEKLFISEFTVRTHRKNIMQKIGVRNGAELINYVNERGLL